MSDHTSISPVEERFEGRGGLSIFMRSWHPLGTPRAVIAICHGLNSHSGQYAWVAQQFVAAGYAVYALDLRGRGQSDGERFFVESVADYVEDLATLIRTAKAREPGLPVFLLGHSAGGVVSCTYALDHQEEIAGLICESFAFQVPAPDFALAVIKGISHLAPHAHVLKLHIEDFTRAPAALAALKADPLIANEVQPSQTVAALVRADERLKREFPRIVLPVLILHGTADKATKPSGSVMFHETAGSADKTLKLYDGAYHDLLADIGKEEVMADIIAWVDTRAAGASAAA
ncbi:MAG: lipase [Rhizobiales bacterium 24-66-13]|jgi:alpha-beta hydrolase superfamily lysophospholipase|nr:MAG: lipase [Rhizobiales bacterium 32-66-11]OYY14021.1 MAG: lipase [Rhizobiales bacterium 35-68-8]OYZ83111.1 MAG: lipase [Rhizobiales bacterium 24-66-13]OZB12041.1 MAG: lipase [Rhizobiales bacterium 39-66-18]HQS45624.1 lysophospholipase [Xanthobacteraceae bacterium]